MNDFTKAAAAVIALASSGDLPELIDELGAARRAWQRQEREQAIGLTPWLQLLASDMARATGIDRSRWEAALVEARGGNWPAKAIDEISMFAERVKAKERQGTRTDLKHSEKFTECSGGDTRANFVAARTRRRVVA